MSEIVYKSKNAVVIYKPASVPSQADKSGDEDAMTLTAAKLRELGESDTLYLIHRLDRVVGGLLIFARSKAGAAKLSAFAAAQELGKEYLAVIEGEPTEKSGIMRDYIYKDSTLSKAFVTGRARGGVKEAVLEYTALDTVDTVRGRRTLVRICLKTGRFHQIRAQFSSRKMPLVGDGKYGSRDFGSRMPALFAFRLSAMLGDEKIDAERLPDISQYPWNLFSREKYLF